MAVKVLNTTVIDNNRNITSAVGTLTMTDDYGPDVHVTASNVSGSSPSLDIESNSQIFLNLTGNGVVTLANSQRGCLSEIIMTTNGNTPTFDGTDFYWSGDITPPWGDHDIWRISCVGLSSSGTCAASAVGYDESGTFIPTSGTGVTAVGREAADGDLMDGNISCYSTSSPPSSSMDANLRFSRSSGFLVQIDGEVQGCSGGVIEWHDGSSWNTLGTSLQTIYTNTTATPTAIKLVANEITYFDDGSDTILTVSGSSSSGSYTLGNWFSTTSNGQWININFDARAEGISGISEYNAVNFVYDVEVWGRGAGFDDTLLATYRISGLIESDYL